MGILDEVERFGRRAADETGDADYILVRMTTLDELKACDAKLQDADESKKMVSFGAIVITLMIYNE
jgi:hypothetical protein